jgi:hypothetical protein
MTRADWFAIKIATFNALAFSLIIGCVTYLDARLPSHKNSQIFPQHVRIYPHGYLISLLGGAIIFGTTLLALTKISSWRLKATLPALIIAVTGVVSLPFFRPEFPHGGITSWIMLATLISLVSCFVHFLPIEAGWLTAADISTESKTERAKECVTLWRTIAISTTLVLIVILIPWVNFIWNLSPHIVSNEAEAFMLSQFGMAGVFCASIYILFGIIYESFRKAHDAADLLLRGRMQELHSEQRTATAALKTSALRTAGSTRDQVFISYSHKDKEWLDRLQTMLKPLVRNGAVSVWAETTLHPGVQWREELEKGLASAKVAVLLVSDHFLASDFIAQEELPPLLTAAKKEGVRILWVYLRPCLYEATPIAGYQAGHNVKKALVELSEPDQQVVLLNVARAIQKAAES